ncbi:hypothetical protein HK097_005544 [Rhizophlyctis rosea]|uniref:Rubisco LSMT substrate-binding domain-containing protein n=1 Tax=Rhizophlyctis rosea TaxID=64517 RepID=A0AAD5SM40_9FUNG|nr:hypothetical protein HK097_005544 [Rhizophlyctis rosea]
MEVMEPNIHSFRNWLDKHGVDHRNVKMRTGQSGVALNAAVDLVASSHVFSIPCQLLLGPHQVPNIPSFIPIYKYLCDHTEEKGGGSSTDPPLPDPQIVLILLLLHTKSHPDRLEWSPYVNCLPLAFPTPLYLLARKEAADSAGGDAYDPMERIAGSPLHSILFGALEDLRAAYLTWIPELREHFGDAAFTEEHSSFLAFVWAHSAIESRAFRLRESFLNGTLQTSESVSPAQPSATTEEPYITCLVPFGDFADHAPIASATLFSTTIPDFLVFSTLEGKPVPKGSPLLITYNILSNEELLLHYGFAMADNPLDRVVVGLEVPEDQADYTLEVRKALLLDAAEQETAGGVEIKLDGHALALQNNGGVPEGLIQSLRLLLATSEELEGITTQNVVQRLSVPLSARNEEQAVGTLVQLADGMLSGYLENSSVGETGFANQWERFADIYIQSQKEILREVVKWGKERMRS